MSLCHYLHVALIDMINTYSSKFLSHNHAKTLDELQKAMEDACIEDSKTGYLPSVTILDIIPGWRDAIDAAIGTMTGQSVPHVFK